MHGWPNKLQIRKEGMPWHTLFSYLILTVLLKTFGILTIFIRTRLAVCAE